MDAFTFQYGQIYYTKEYPKNETWNSHLHSNMVRFIIPQKSNGASLFLKFTFQYGQIYYQKMYILENIEREDLHSNMVRFIIFYY